MKKRMMSLLMALTMSLTLLRTEIEATTEDGTETLSLASWSCDDEVMRMAEGHSHCICGESHKAIGEHNGEDSVSFDRKLSSNYTGRESWSRTKNRITIFHHFIDMRKVFLIKMFDNLPGITRKGIGIRIIFTQVIKKEILISGMSARVKR